MFNTKISNEDVKSFYTHNAEIILKMKNSQHKLKEKDELLKISESYHQEKINSLPFNGVRELMEFLKSENILIAMSSLSKKENCIPILEKNDFIKYFDIILNRDDNISKTLNVETILEKENLKPEEAVFVTDTLGDVREMDVIGVYTIAVTYGMHERAFFEKEKNENLIYIVDSVEELKNKLENII